MWFQSHAALTDPQDARVSALHIPAPVTHPCAPFQPPRSATRRSATCVLKQLICLTIVLGLFFCAALAQTAPATRLSYSEAMAKASLQDRIAALETFVANYPSGPERTDALMALSRRLPAGRQPAERGECGHATAASRS